eukprot:scaffold7017_cov134-Cylindrotheca_fusiformis.AAC.12
MEHQEGENQQPPVMMSLLEKYSKMDSQMDQVRQETARVQQEMQRRQAATKALLEEREEMKLLQERTQQQQRDLTNEVEEAMEKLHQLAEERAQAESKKEEAQARLDRTKQRSISYREQFLHVSRKFRSQCERLEMTRQSLGAPNESLAALALANHPHLVDAFEETDDASEDEDDFEYSQALETVRALEQSHAESKKARDELVAKKDHLEERSNKRKTQQVNLENQLNRIVEDSKKIKAQIQEVRAAQAAEAMSDNVVVATTGMHFDPMTLPNSMLNMSSSKFCVHIGPSTDTAAIRNPYARPNRIPPQADATTKRTTVPTANQPFWASTTNKAHGTRIATNSTTGTTSNRTEQYPHRVGRLRNSRDFGISLRMDDEESEDSDDELLSDTSTSKGWDSTADVTPATHPEAQVTKSCVAGV